MALDPFASFTETLIAPAGDLFAIEPDDLNDLAKATRAIYVGGGGDIIIKAVHSENEVLLSNVPTGTVLAIRVAAVRASGTSAFNLVGLA
jgi:hypothetical protein